MNNMYCVYIHKAPDGRKYVGMTRQNPIKRWRNGRGYRNQKHFFTEIQNIGWENIEHIIVAENLDEASAKLLEKKLIKENKTQDIKYGFNTKNGGQVFGEHSEEFINELSNRMKGNTYCVGRKLSQRHIDALRNSNIGAHRPSKHKGECLLSESAKKTISEKAKLRYRNPDYIKFIKATHADMSGNKNPMFGKKHSDETKELIRRKAIGRKVTDESRKRMSESARKQKVYKVDIESESIIELFDSCKDAAKNINGNISNISFACRNKSKTYKGFKWRYAYDIN